MTLRDELFYQFVNKALDDNGEVWEEDIQSECDGKLFTTTNRVDEHTVLEILEESKRMDSAKEMCDILYPFLVEQETVEDALRACAATELRFMVVDDLTTVGVDVV